MLIMDGLYALIYVLIGVFFAELTLRNHPRHATQAAKVFAYCAAIWVWPYIVYLSIRGSK